MRHYFAESMTTTKPEPRHRICMQDGLVTLQQRGKDNFAVRYGKEVYAELSYAFAASKLGEALMHQLACDEKLDNRMRGEA
jgi:hypothetical protein